MCIRDRPTTVIKGLIDVESFGVMRDPSLNEEENVEDLTKKQKDKKTSEKKERDYEDELMSAAELHTTDTAEETDIEEAKLSRKAQRLQDKMEEMAYKMKIETSQTSSTNEPSTSDASHELSEDYETSFKIDKMLAEMEEKEKEVIEQFEVEYEKAKRKDLFMYGQEEDKKALEVSEFLKQREALKAIPNSVVSKIADFSSPRLKYQTIEDIETEKKDARFAEPVEKIDSSAIVEIFKSEVSALERTPDLTKKEINKLKDLRKLLDNIGELPVPEPSMLLRVYQIYHPDVKVEPDVAQQMRSTNSYV
eukprot:TRINITY_DN4978_c0_g1_i3.p1 TRINITY_DN4978_c0_g1~~TRINITY_DN4978_c0_g1_i3.p1  ORF type:complete len:323 (+),score=105.48 TRINITY_DN4978_c0_g1_i3:49-969(+)